MPECDSEIFDHFSKGPNISPHSGCIKMGLESLGWWSSIQADSVVGTADVSEASFITMLTLSVS